MALCRIVRVVRLLAGVGGCKTCCEVTWLVLVITRGLVYRADNPVLLGPLRAPGAAGERQMGSRVVM